MPMPKEREKEAVEERNRYGLFIPDTSIIGSVTVKRRIPATIATADGKEVSIRKERLFHMPGALRNLLIESISRVRIGDRYWVLEEIEYPTTIGCSNLVQTTEADSALICYARRSGRKCFSRCVREKSLTPTCKFSVELKERDEAHGRYFLRNAYAGEMVFPESDDLTMLSKSRRGRRMMHGLLPKAKAFWTQHAFVLRYTDVLIDTVVDHLPRDYNDGILSWQEPII